MLGRWAMEHKLEDQALDLAVVLPLSSTSESPKFWVAKQAREPMFRVDVRRGINCSLQTCDCF